MNLAQRILLTGIGWLGMVCLILFYLHKGTLNGFKRGRIYQGRQLQVLDLKYNGWYIAGLSHNRIYLGKINAPLGLLSCSYNLKDSLHQKLRFSPTLKLDWQVARTHIDSPYVYLYDYKTPALFSAKADKIKQRLYPLARIHFDLMQLLSPGSVIVNGYDPAIQQKSIQKVWLRPKPVTDHCQSYAHQLQRAGNFSIDGFLTPNKKKNAILFTYYYRNQFICLDTNLNLRYIGTTIDTNTVAKVETGELEQGDKNLRTITNAPVVVSKRAYSDGSWIYIHAGLKADNEALKMFEERVIIDVYQLNTGAYSHSLYLPVYKGEKLTGFAVRGNLLIALHGQYMVTYSINIHKIPIRN